MPQKDDYRKILKSHLAERCKLNARYSLRAFARDLGLAPSRLSEVLNGKQGLSRQAASHIAGSLGMNSGETDYFCELVASLHARSAKDREIAKIKLQKFEQSSEAYQLQLDSFKIISDWYHLGILELTKISGFQNDSIWIGKKLGISVMEVELAIERLKRVGLLKEINKKLVLIQTDGEVAGGVSSDSIKQFHQQVIEKSVKALHVQPIDRRDYSSNIVAINKKKLPDAIKELRDFEEKFCDKVEKSSLSKDSVYCLSIQFFDLLKD